MSTNPPTPNVQEGLTINASDLEFNAEGEPLTIADPSKLTYSVDDSTIATLKTNADDPTIAVGTAKVFGVKVGTCNVTSTDSSQTPPLVSDPAPLAVTMDPVAKKLVVNFA